MLTMEKLNPSADPVSVEIAQNLGSLLQILLKLEAAYGKPLYITSGLRTMSHHLAIYAAKNAARAKQGLPPLAVPMASKHLYGQAADIADVGGDFWKWCMVNMDLMTQLGVYFEDRAATPTWVHIQIVAPKSGKRIFMP